MRIDMKREAELAQRKGFADRTLLSLAGMGVTFVIALLLATMLFSLDIITPEFFYEELVVPTLVGESVLRLTTTFAFFVVLQFILLMGYAILSPSARAKTGQATARAIDPDYYDMHFGNDNQMDMYGDSYSGNSYEVAEYR